MKYITLLSPAKVNLTFEILSKRNDGYHEIRSIMQPVNLFDKVIVEVEDGRGINLICRGIKISDDSSNLAYRAAELYLSSGKVEKQVTITLYKSIPLGSGLGGGSSNAAAVLIALNRLLELFSENELIQMSPVLGADVPFFIGCRSAFVEGFGEKITPLPEFPIFYYVVIYPRIEISTQEVYDKWDSLNIESGKYRSDLELDGLNQVFLNTEEEPPVFSDLEEPAFELYPVLKTYKQLMHSLDSKSVIISGSGSCIFSVFRKEDQAQGLYSYLATNNDIDTFFLKGISGWHRLAE